MAKETKFTDIEIEICGKKCHFNRVTNKELVQFSDKAEKDYDKLVKTWTDKAQELSFAGETIEKQIERKSKKMELLEKLDDADINEIIDLNDELEQLDEELSKITKQLLDHNDKNPSKKYSEIVDKTLAEKAELLLDNITAKDYETNATYRDTSIARNLEKYYQLSMAGERPKKIEVEIEEDMKRFLKEQEELRNS